MRGLSRRGFLGGIAGLLATPHIARGWSGVLDVPGLRPDADNSAALNDAVEQMAGGGGTLRLPHGRWRLSAPLRLKSGITLAGQDATLVADDRWTMPRQTRVSRYALVTNRNEAADRPGDADIAVRELGFLYAGEQHGDAHALTFRQAHGLRIAGCRFEGGGDAVALLACRDAVTERCTAAATMNCAFDHWEGTSDALVRDCHATCRTGYGILFTGQGTRKGDDHTAERLTATGNTIENASNAGIWVCTLSEHSVIAQVLLQRNTIRAGTAAGAGPTGAGLGATGDVRNLRILDNRVEGIAGPNAIFTRPDRWNRPRQVEIAGNQLIGCTTADANAALIQAFGDTIAVHGNRAEGGRFPSLVWVDGNDVRLSDNQGRGTGRKYRAEHGRVPMMADP